MARALRLQSMGESSLAEHGRVGHLRSRPGACGRRYRPPGSEWSRRAPGHPAPPGGSVSCWAVLLRANGGRASARSHRRHPASCAIYMMDTPVSVSPFRIAQLMGAAPRYLGKSDAWTLMEPYLGVSRMSSGRILAVGRHHDQLRRQLLHHGPGPSRPACCSGW